MQQRQLPRRRRGVGGSGRGELRRRQGAGLQNMVGVTSTRQFNETVNASVGLSWQPEAGLGLQVGPPSCCQLAASWQTAGRRPRPCARLCSCGFIPMLLRRS